VNPRTAAADDKLVRVSGDFDASPVPELGELEHEVMDVLWDAGESTVRSVLGALNERSGRQRAYTTVMTVMGNLHRKGALTRRRQGRMDLYVPVLGRDEWADARARRQVGAIVDEYGDLAFAHFAREAARLDPDRRRRLQELLERD
jgi:predicted transcriptional regulator